MQDQSTRRRAARRPRVERSCLRCGAVFLARQSELDAGRGLYCSYDCSAIAQRSRVNRTCRQCGVMFTATPSKIARRGALYCSRACRREYEAPTAKNLSLKLQEHARREDTCLMWTGPVDADGYGRCWVGHTSINVHVIAYEIAYGPVPAGFHVDHLCHNADPACPGGPTCRHRRCIERTHLEPVPPRTNILRGKGFAAKNARKTHCPYGHPYDGDNLYIQPKSGGRACRTCYLERFRRRAKPVHQ